MMTLSTFAAGVLIYCASLGRAYHIDDSCNTDRVMIKRAMDSAFHMADLGASALEASPRNALVLEAAQKFFGKDGVPGADLDLSFVQSTLRDIYDYLHTETTTPSQSDVTIYCDETRFEPNTKGKYYTDKTIKADVAFIVEGCKSTGDRTNRYNLAFTWNPVVKTELGKGVTKSTNYPTQITLCPWFLEWARAQEYTVWDDIKLKTKIGKYVINWASKNRWPFTQIDTIVLLDKVLLHELGHSRVAHSLVDVEMSCRPFNLAYGFRCCKTLARTGPAVGIGDEGAADHNPDSLALFSSVVRLIQEGVPPQTVDGDGKVVPI